MTPNGSRLSCSALVKDQIPYVRRQLQALVRQRQVVHSKGSGGFGGSGGHGTRAGSQGSGSLGLGGFGRSSARCFGLGCLFILWVQPPLSNGARLSCGALKKNSFPNLCAPPASSAG